MDLVALALYDVVLYCDDSGSMAFEEGVRISLARTIYHLLLLPKPALEGICDCLHLGHAVVKCRAARLSKKLCSRPCSPYDEACFLFSDTQNFQNKLSCMEDQVDFPL